MKLYIFVDESSINIYSDKKENWANKAADFIWQKAKSRDGGCSSEETRRGVG